MASPEPDRVIAFTQAFIWGTSARKEKSMFPPRPPPPPQGPRPVRPPEVVVQLDSGGWETAIRNAISSRNQLKIVLRGARVAAVKGSFPDICKIPGPPAPYVPVPYPNVAGSLQGAGLVSLALLITSAAAAGYAPPGTNYNSRGAGIQDDEFTIYLR
jgi:hypothetical protein